MDIEVTQQPFNLQMELCDLQEDPFFIRKKLISRKFWKILSREVPQASKFLP
jgi:hypothetical protein